ncbi:hypothetical protein [Providencia rettgeri]|mgnify:CR=1 FL=1|uniref:hypothetical protein n=1 Tax=Providencia rettgeri TaxID=587 RepID=UPI00235F31AA|nr:hypothetical protein [Providencia rettgeri]
MLKKLSLLLLVIIPTQVFAIPDMTKNELTISAQKEANTTSVIEGSPFYVTTFSVGLSVPEKYKDSNWILDGCFIAITDNGDKFHGAKMDSNMLTGIMKNYTYTTGKMEFKSKDKKLYDAIFINWTADKCP